jgi:methylated-DNA-[protein]-cysteine S-methyltransferase
MQAIQYFVSPIGTLQICASQKGVSSITFVETKGIDAGNNHSALACQQLHQYFSGTLKKFSIDVDLKGTAFQQNVWQLLAQIEYGKTASYKQMAVRLGDIKCIRAAASANGKNPLAIVIPCHRVIGTNGKLIEYAAGVWRKKWLLQHEGVLPSDNLIFN